MLLTLVLAACGDGGGSEGSAYCKQLRESAKEAAATTTSVVGPATSIDYKALQGRFDQALEKISSKAPDELKDDYDVVQNYFQLYLGALANRQAAATSELQALAPKYRTAQEAIVKYNKEQCDFETTTVPPATPTTARG